MFEPIYRVKLYVGQLIVIYALAGDVLRTNNSLSTHSTIILSNTENSDDRLFLN